MSANEIIQEHASPTLGDLFARMEQSFKVDKGDDAELWAAVAKTKAEIDAIPQGKSFRVSFGCCPKSGEEHGLELKKLLYWTDTLGFFEGKYAPKQ